MAEGNGQGSGGDVFRRVHHVTGRVEEPERVSVARPGREKGHLYGRVRRVGRERKQPAAPQQRVDAGGRVEFPEFAAVDAIVGHKEQGAVPGGEVMRRNL